MKISEIKEIINIIKNEPFSILIIFSLLILPVIFFEWLHFFPESWKIWIMIAIIAIWAAALLRLRKELLMYRRKVILFNYLKKEKRHSIDHLCREWAGKDDFSEKNIYELIRTYPDTFKFVTVKSQGKDKKGVGLIELSDNNSEE